MGIEQVRSQQEQTREGGAQHTQVVSVSASATSSGTGERHNGHAQARAHDKQRQDDSARRA